MTRGYGIHQRNTRCLPWRSLNPSRMGVSHPPKNVSLCMVGVEFCYRCISAVGRTPHYPRLCFTVPVRRITRKPINTYSVVQDSTAAHLASRTFANCQTATRRCKVTGPTLRSDLRVGKRPKQSDT